MKKTHHKKKKKLVLKLDKVTKTYYMGENTLDALKSLELEIREGDFVSVMGPSGSGKSTFLNVVGVLDRPSKGKIYIDGRDTSEMSDDYLAKIRGKKIGFIFQSYNLIPNLSALENVMLPMWFQGTPKEERRVKAMELLTMVGLADRMHHKPSELSGGQKQRVAIARALSNDPEVLLCDEPTGNLDTKSGAEVLDILIDLHKIHGKTIILVTHNPTQAMISERLIMLVDGAIVGQAKTEREKKKLLKHLEEET